MFYILNIYNIYPYKELGILHRFRGGGVRIGPIPHAFSEMLTIYKS